MPTVLDRGFGETLHKVLDDLLDRFRHLGPRPIQPRPCTPPPHPLRSLSTRGSRRLDSGCPLRAPSTTPPVLQETLRPAPQEHPTGTIRSPSPRPRQRAIGGPDRGRGGQDGHDRRPRRGKQERDDQLDRHRQFQQCPRLSRPPTQGLGIRAFTPDKEG